MKSAARRNFVPLGLVAMPPSGCLVGPVGALLPKPGTLGAFPPELFDQSSRTEMGNGSSMIKPCIFWTKDVLDVSM